MGSGSSRPSSRRGSAIGLNAKNASRKGSMVDPSVAATLPKNVPTGTEVMISYSHADTDMMKKLRSSLEASGLTVWVDISGLTAGVDFLSKIGEAIIDAKLFVSLLSEKTVASRCCQDELALAYVSQKPIFPVGLQEPQHLFPLMNTGMRLQLARFDWFMINDPDIFEESMEKITSALKEQLNEMEDTAKSLPGSKPDKNISDRKEARSSLRGITRQKTIIDRNGNSKADVDTSFWQRHFAGEDSVSWDRFSDAFYSEYAAPMKEMFAEEEVDWVVSLVRRELQVDESENKVLLSKYTDFCTVDGELKILWKRVQDQAVESFAMMEVFNMDSSVRLEAIDNLGKFRSAAVVDALTDLLEDRDNNVRTVAAISLAKTGTNSARIIDKMLVTLSDEDRLVRESGCLALGHLKAKKAVPLLIHLWRNDFISSVREAAQVALEQIGGEEANKAMHITNLLAREIRMLTQD